MGTVKRVNTRCVVDRVNEPTRVLLLLRCCTLYLNVRFGSTRSLLRGDILAVLQYVFLLASYSDGLWRISLGMSDEWYSRALLSKLGVLLFDTEYSFHSDKSWYLCVVRALS